jgi:fructosamine-3-kinase
MSASKDLNKQIFMEVASALSEKIGHEVTIKSTQLLGGGCIHHATKIETSAGPFFLKWNTAGVSDIFLREAEGLAELKKAVSDEIRIPEVIAAKLIDDSPGFLVLEYFQPAGFLQNGDEKLGRGLAAIHRFSSENFGFYNDNYCGATQQNNMWKPDWMTFFTENRLGWMLKLIKEKRFLASSEQQLFEQLIEKLPEIIPADSVPSLIHGDLWSGNYMLTANGPALIDPAASFSDREMEFGMITLFGGFSQCFFDAYHEAFPLPVGWKQRNRLYQLYHILNHYFLFGGGYLQQAVQIARQYL